MESMKVKDLREIAKSNGLRGYSKSKKSEFIGNDYLIEVSEDDCEDLIDYEDSFTKKVNVSGSGAIIEVCEDDCEDLPDCENLCFEKDNFSVKVFKKGRFTIKVCEDVCEDLPDGW